MSSVLMPLIKLASMKLLMVLTLCIITVPVFFAQDQHLIANESIPFSIELRGLIKAAKSDQLKSPAWWKPIKYVVKDGSYVHKGDIVAEFNPLYEDQQYERRLIEKKAIDLELHSKLLDIDNKAQSFNDRIKEMSGKLRVLQAKLKRLQSLPLKSDVLIAKGKLRVAHLEFSEVDDSWTRAQQRFDKGFLSQAELKEIKHNRQAAHARLDHRQSHYDSTLLPTSDNELKIARVHIDNIKLELRKVVFENEKQQKFISINKGDAARRSKRFIRDLKKTEKMLKALKVSSLVDGYVVYSNSFKNDLRNNGGKMRKGRTFIEIPHADSLYIHALLPEQYRQLVAEGNACTVATLGNNAHSYQAIISTIDSRPRDVFDDEENVQWGSEDRESGIKVYGLRVHPVDATRKLRPGTHSQVRISGESRRGPAVPLRFVVIKEGQYYISIDGVYTAVEGSPVNGWLMLKDVSLLEQSVLLKGEFSLRSEGDTQHRNDNGQLIIGGEVSPVKELDIIVGNIQRDTKVTVLADEGSLVHAGDIILEMGETETLEAMGKIEEELDAAIAQREKSEEQISITKINGEIDLQLQKNKVVLAQARLEVEKAQSVTKHKTIADKKLAVDLAVIDKKRADSELQRLQALPKNRVSQTDMVKSERKALRAALGFEKAQIRMYIEEHAYDFHALKQFEKVLLQEQLNLESKTERLSYELSLGDDSLLRSQNKEKKIQGRFDTYKLKMKNLVVHAPSSGIMQYKVIWDSGKLGKVASGSTLRRYMRPVSIADFSKVTVSLELPEMAYPFIRVGQKIDAIIPSLENLSLVGEVDSIKYVFQNKTRKDIQLGMYSDREPLGKSTFTVVVGLEAQQHSDIKPGMHVDIHFPIAWPPRPLLVPLAPVQQSSRAQR